MRLFVCDASHLYMNANMDKQTDFACDAWRQESPPPPTRFYFHTSTRTRDTLVVIVWHNSSQRETAEAEKQMKRGCCLTSRPSLQSVSFHWTWTLTCTSLNNQNSAVEQMGVKFVLQKLDFQHSNLTKIERKSCNCWNLPCLSRRRERVCMRKLTFSSKHRSAKNVRLPPPSISNTPPPHPTLSSWRHTVFILRGGEWWS